MNAVENHRDQIEFIRRKYLTGELSYEDAKKAIQPILDDLNKRCREIAKKYGKKHSPITFAYVMR